MGGEGGRTGRNQTGAARARFRRVAPELIPEIAASQAAKSSAFIESLLDPTQSNQNQQLTL
jgi:hypothetical protein